MAMAMAVAEVQKKPHNVQSNSNVNQSIYIAVATQCPKQLLCYSIYIAVATQCLKKTLRLFHTLPLPLPL